MKNTFSIHGLVILAVALLIAFDFPVQAAPLFGVSGDGASTNPESFFSVSTTDASTTFIHSLGNGKPGESIAFNPSNGLMYHWSGDCIFSDCNLIMETINLGDQTVTNIATSLSYNPAEVLGSTFDPPTGNFLFTDLNENLGSVTPGGIFSLIGSLPDDSIRALGFNGGKLYAGDRFGDTLFELNPTTGESISMVTVTLAGFTVKGINSLTTDPDTGLMYGIIKTPPGEQGVPSGRRLVTIDPLTGIATDIGPLPNGFANIEFGGTYIPEPSAIDHFQCYKVKDLKNPKFDKIKGVQVSDQFGSDVIEVKKPSLLCAPVDKEGSGINDPETHLCCYKIKGTKLDPPAEVEIEDQFGTLELKVKKPELICLPCSKTVLQ